MGYRNMYDYNNDDDEDCNDDSYDAAADSNDEDKDNCSSLAH